MTRFYLNDKSRFTAVMRLVIDALDKYNTRSFDADTALIAALNEAIATYKELARTDREGQCQALKADWALCQRGVNPATLEKLTTRRGEMVNSTCYKILQRLQQIVSDDLQETEAVLKEAEALVGQIVIASVQNGKLTADHLKKSKKPKSMENIWKALAADANVAIGQKRVQLLVNRYDSLILFEDMIRQLQ